MSEIKILADGERRPIGALVPYARNSRTHSEEQIDQLAASFREWGFTMPVLIDEAGGLIAGHGRVMAAQRLGMTELPVIVARDWSDAKKRAYVIADNKLALNAGWDEEMLAKEMAALGEFDFDLTLTGFDGEELINLLMVFYLGSGGGAASTGKEEEGEPPLPPAVATSRLGDVWMMGPHRAMCGDSTRPENVAALMAGGLADMLLTDPPYNVAYQGKTADALTIQNDSMDDAAFRGFLASAFGAALTGMRPGAVYYIWHADSEGYNFRGACKDVGLRVRQCLIWLKQTMVLGRQDYHWRHEPCLYGWKDGAAHLWNTDRKQTTILEFDKPSRNGEHPTMKPVALFEYQMLNNTGVGNVVLDLFGGSGTTLIAAEKNERVARLMELEPGYMDVIVLRWQAYSGGEAIHEATGMTWSQVFAQRAAERATLPPVAPAGEAGAGAAIGLGAGAGVQGEAIDALAGLAGADLADELERAT